MANQDVVGAPPFSQNASLPTLAEHMAWLEVNVTEQRVTRLIAAAKAGEPNASQVAALIYAELLEFQPDKLNTPQALALKQVANELPAEWDAVALGVGVYKAPSVALSAIKTMPEQLVHATQLQAGFIGNLAKSDANLGQKVEALLTHQLSPLMNSVVSALPLNSSNKDADLNLEQQIALAKHYRDCSGFDRRIETYTNVAAQLDLMLASTLVGSASSRLVGGGMGKVERMAESEGTFVTTNGARLQADTAAVDVNDKPAIAGGMRTTAAKDAAGGGSRHWVTDFSEQEVKDIPENLVKSASNYLDTLARDPMVERKFDNYIRLDNNLPPDASPFKQAKHHYYQALEAEYPSLGDDTWLAGKYRLDAFAKLVRDREFLLLAKAPAGSVIDYDLPTSKVWIANTKSTHGSGYYEDVPLAVITPPEGKPQLVRYETSSGLVHEKAQYAKPAYWAGFNRFSVAPVKEAEIDELTDGIRMHYGEERAADFKRQVQKFDFRADAENSGNLALAVNHLEHAQSRDIVTSQIDIRLKELAAVNSEKAEAQLNA